MENEMPTCARCTFKIPERACRKEEGKAPPFCPTRNKTDVLQRAQELLLKPENYEFAKQASIQEGEGYGDKVLGYALVKPVKPRIMEIVEFAGKMKYKRLGFAFCSGLAREAEVVGRLLASKGFEVVSSICKVGCRPKEALGVRDEQKIQKGSFEPMCNPIAQALILNEAQTEFNVVLGLCVGHDSLFMRYSDAFCTVLVAKDRVTGHNPLAAIQLYKSYYKKLTDEKFKKGGAVSVTVKQNR